MRLLFLSHLLLGSMTGSLFKYRLWLIYLINYWLNWLLMHLHACLLPLHRIANNLGFLLLLVYLIDSVTATSLFLLVVVLFKSKQHLMSILDLFTLILFQSRLLLRYILLLFFSIFIVRFSALILAVSLIPSKILLIEFLISLLKFLSCFNSGCSNINVKQSLPA